MAKKKTTAPDTPPQPSAPRRRAASPARRNGRTGENTPAPEPAVTAEPLDLAADMSVAAGSSDSAAAREPSYDEIAEAAYHRYLQRGEQHGNDFDDWLEAERSLKRR